jgi:hypothetical protein
MHGALKASLHKSGNWRFAYDERFFEESVRPEDKTEKGRFINNWHVPTAIAPRVLLAFRIVTPWTSVCTAHAYIPNVFCVLKPAEGKAIEFDVFFVEAMTPVSGWPGKN